MKQLCSKKSPNDDREQNITGVNAVSFKQFLYSSSADLSHEKDAREPLIRNILRHCFQL